MLEVHIEAPPGTHAGLVEIADRNGDPVESFTESTSGIVQLSVPLGEYHLSFNPPTGYQVAATSAPVGPLIVHTSRNYGDVENTFVISVKFEKLPPG